ncbi:MAG: MarR family winged helix-turn-helix transcriptional regulator [Candidatus Sulfotelmatobacter sp.]
MKKTHLALAAHASMIQAKESLVAMQSHQLESFGLTISRFRVLELLLRGGPMSQSDLGALLFWGHSNTHFLVSKLEGWGLVVRKPEERDKRVATIHLTPEGEKLIAEAFPLHAMLVRAQMSVLETREQETLCRLCMKLSQGDAGRFILELASSAREEITEAEETVER